MLLTYERERIEKREERERETQIACPKLGVSNRFETEIQKDDDTTSIPFLIAVHLSQIQTNPSPKCPFLNSF
ncbi:hypothetical protein LOK49_LG04G00055 [Camellia lanceoleosa]|uniref:Uncharacterized protein n=1 Tax=Camellia lanceoleosa TaxID=1840588 RepID=A0ACC0HYM4_9ERIC|nr:hypothetical protein LOK49_LG04G00055 [Camellia lanceoleosa]